MPRRRMHSSLTIAVGALAVIASCGGDDDATNEQATNDAGSDASGTDASVGSSDANVDGGDALIDSGPPAVMPVGPAVVSAGPWMGCRIAGAGALRCWGGGKGTPEDVLGGSTFTDVSGARVRFATGIETCAIRSDGVLFCWDDWAAPVQMNGTWKRIAIGVTEVCAIGSDDSLQCAPSGTGAPLSFQAVSPDADWAHLSAGSFHQCALRKSGALYCRGRNTSGQIGLPPTSTEPLTRVGGASSKWKDAAAGGDSTCAIAEGGTLSCWGTINAKTTPTPVDAATDWARVSVGEDHACALKTNGTLHCFGKNARGQVGAPDRLAKTTPFRVTNETDWTSVSAGARYTCATKKDGSARCWGSDGVGQLGRGTSHLAPTKIGGTEWKQVSVGTATCAVRLDGTMACWGVLDGPNDDVAQAPVAIGQGTSWSAVATSPSAAHACARASTGAVSCWGYSFRGENGSASFLAAPTAVGLCANVVAVGRSHSCAVDLAGALFCWGEAASGTALGSDTSTPTKVGADTWATLAADSRSSCGIRSDGSLWCWGQYFSGIQQVGSDSDWTAITGTSGGTFAGIRAGGTAAKTPGNASPLPADPLAAIAGYGTHFCAIETDGTLVCQGTAARGEVGDGTVERRYTAVPIGSATDWKSLSAGPESMCAIRGGGDLHCWGSNEDGALGDGTSWIATPVAVLP